MSRREGRRRCPVCGTPDALVVRPRPVGTPFVCCTVRGCEPATILAHLTSIEPTQGTSNANA
jgi:hypothetical protein